MYGRGWYSMETRHWKQSQRAAELTEATVLTVNTHTVCLLSTGDDRRITYSLSHTYTKAVLLHYLMSYPRGGVKTHTWLTPQTLTGQGASVCVIRWRQRCGAHKKQWSAINAFSCTFFPLTPSSSYCGISMPTTTNTTTTVIRTADRPEYTDYFFWLQNMISFQNVHEICRLLLWAQSDEWVLLFLST